MTPAHLPERVPCSYGKDVEDLYCCGITSKTQGEVEKKKKASWNNEYNIFYHLSKKESIY